MTEKSKTILIATIIVAAVAAIAVLIAVKHHSKPDLTKISPRQIREHSDSNQSRDANEGKRHDIREQAGETMRTRVETQADEYFSLPDEKKTAYLDKIIDDMEARRAEVLAKDTNGPPDPNRFRRFGPRDANSPRQQMAIQQSQRPEPPRMREGSEKMSTDARVKTNQFRRALMNRMRERGIQNPMMGGPEGRGGFGGPNSPGGRPPN
jgi:hypothetical protein